MLNGMYREEKENQKKKKYILYICEQGFLGKKNIRKKMRKLFEPNTREDEYDLIGVDIRDIWWQTARVKKS